MFCLVVVCTVLPRSVRGLERLETELLFNACGEFCVMFDEWKLCVMSDEWNLGGSVDLDVAVARGGIGPTRR